MVVVFGRRIYTNITICASTKVREWKSREVFIVLLTYKPKLRYIFNF